MFKVHNPPERRQWRLYGVFIIKLRENHKIFREHRQASKTKRFAKIVIIEFSR